MNKYTKLLNNSIIFAFGSLSSKLIVILLVPLYTYYLSSQDYGVVDLITSTQALLMPFITLTVEQAILRYIIGSKDKNEINSIFSSAFFICVISVFVFLIVCIILFYFRVWDPKLIFYFYLLICISSFQVIFSTYLRAVDKNKIFAVNGIIQVLTLLVFNVLFLVAMDLGIDGYLISLILSYVVSTIFCLCNSRDVGISYKLVSSKTLRKIISFSFPLIPNYSMWWLVNNSTRYVVLSFVGLSANGLFAVASKIPMCINVFVTVFQQAWQISAFEEFESQDRSKYYSSVFRHYYLFLFLLASFLLVINKWIFTYLVSDEYFLAWEMVPFLVFGVLYQTFSSFLGTIYTANYKTKSVFMTSAIGAGISIGSNFIFIPLYGAAYAGLGAALGFFIMWVFRLRDTRKIVYTELNYLEFFLLNVVYLIQIALLFIFRESSLFMVTAVQSFTFCIVIFISRSFIYTTLTFAKKKFLKKH
ncbi:oligosaccharide flippase family protein [Raoultella planticola]|uniref:lipopolysaccharide biosynthesis protein n=1 Tax=Raoultella planticola TaxID=575 RepID=UPI0021B06D8D|nr:oligosaccharide flippase family protein [Raoultella planticola]MCS7489998.1 oligosaccharide flippase family protein [Raoultella planticola]MDC3907954.1 oligosaccharide flippase family protein [Raoultella planticola]